MTTSTSARTGDRILSISLSVLVHAAIVGALLWGWWHYRTPKSVPPTLAIQATVVRTAPEPPTAPTPSAAPAPVPPAPSAPSAAEQQAREHAEAVHRAAQEAAASAAAAKAQEAAAAAARKAEEEAARLAQEQAERKAKEEAAQRAKQQAEQRAKQEAEHLAEQLKAEQAAQQREADLRSQLQAEEHLEALQSSPAKAEYLALIQARITHAWNRPASAQPGTKCIVHLRQIPGGEVTHVSVEGCNGDDAVRESVETAAYRASPLPAPSDPQLFDPNITVTFAPDE